MKRMIAMLLMLAVLLTSAAAFDYGSEIYVDAAEDLPESILAAMH